MSTPTSPPAPLSWERNLPPAMVGMIRGIPWAIIFVALISIVGFATKGQHIHWPGWLVPAIPSAVFAMRTLEGMVDQAKHSNPGAYGSMGLILQSLEGLAGQIAAAQPKPIPPGGAPATISIHVGNAEQVRAAGAAPADPPVAPSGPVLPPSNIESGVAPEVQASGAPSGQDTTAFVPRGQFP